MIDAMMSIITIKIKIAFICFSNDWENFLISFNGGRAPLHMKSPSATLDKININFFPFSLSVLLEDSDTMYINSTMTPLTYTIRISTPVHVSILCLKAKYATKNLFTKIVIRRAIGFFLLAAVMAMAEIVITQKLVHLEWLLWV